MGSSEHTFQGDAHCSGDSQSVNVVSSGPAEIVPILLPGRLPPDHAALRPAVHEVCLPEAAPVHPLPLRYEAPQPRAHGEHHLVPGPDAQDELQLQCLPPAGETQAPETEAKGPDGTKDQRSGGRHEGILGIFLARRFIF